MKSLIILSSFVLLILFVGCSDNNNIAENIKISECGGFESGVVTKLPSEDGEDVVADCSQLLIWSYDESSGVLNIMNEAVSLNCCGKHSVLVKENDGGYDFNIIDKSDNGARCDCDCSFDFGADITGVENSPVNLKVYTDVEEEEEKTLQWEGTLDMTQKNGTIIVKERTGDWCH
ncbi:MAG TPA: hypothetical protein PLZ43_12120 [bacterium]|nr:hypothetical protein [bacterium]